MKTLKTVTIILFILAVLLFAGVSGYYSFILDRVSPVISVPEGILDVRVNDGTEALLAGVTASDNRDGSLTDQIMIQGVSRLLSANTARVTYVVFDGAKNMGTATRTIRYTDYQRPIISLTQPPVFKPYPEGDSITELLDAVSARDVRDGDISDQIQIAAQNVNDSVAGTYRIHLQVTNSMGDTESIPLTVIISESGSSNLGITLREYITYASQGEAFDPYAFVSTVGGTRYTSSNRDLAVESDVDTAVPGYYQVSYRCIQDGHDHTAYLTVVVR